jgi:hypothetical protein
MSKRCLTGPIDCVIGRPSAPGAPFLSTPIASSRPSDLTPSRFGPGDRSTATSGSMTGKEDSFRGEPQARDQSSIQRM